MTNQDEVVELTDHGASDLCKQPALGRFVCDPVHLAHFSDAGDNPCAGGDGEESNRCKQNSQALSNQLRANHQNTEEHRDRSEQ